MTNATMRGFDYRGLKLGFAGLAVTIIGFVPTLLWPANRVLQWMAYGVFVMGFALAGYGLFLHWRGFIKMDAARRNRTHSDR